ncbi:hypothetical protein ACFWDQ_14615 [Streptomyces sp. NPDC060053]|uniref:hypothetical protein n=1 Tax=Streptomyces sp. NPDC060053 TaxID=3347047 RepID=UPI0036AD183E
MSAAAIVVHGDQDPLPAVALANEVLALWDRPRIVRTVLEGAVGPGPGAQPGATDGRPGHLSER